MNAKKKNSVEPGRLRLVKLSEEDPIDPIVEDPQPSSPGSSSRSAFVRGVAHFADDLDRMIEQILKS